MLATILPDLVLMDISMPLLNDIETKRQALEKYADLKIIALSITSITPK